MANDPKNANKPDAIKERWPSASWASSTRRTAWSIRPFIKDGSMDVKKYVEATGKELGGAISIVEYTHFVKGEGLEKRNEDFAARSRRCGQGLSIQIKQLDRLPPAGVVCLFCCPAKTGLRRCPGLAYTYR